MKHHSVEHGFSLAEILVALAVFGFGLNALIDLKVALANRQARLLTQLDAITLESNALVLLRRVNPTIEPAGKRSLGGDVQLIWQAHLNGPYVQQLSWAGRQTPERLALYRVEYRIIDKAGTIASNRTELLGRSSPMSADRRRAP